MKRIIKREKIDYQKFLVKIRISEDETTNTTLLSSNKRQSLIDLLNAVIHQPDLVEYGQFKPDKLEIFNENEKWVLISTINEDHGLTT